MEYSLRRYTDNDKRLWDDFVKSSRNGTFLFLRDYMDYHADRFSDCSWIAYKGSAPVALLPANIDSGMTLRSHQGLTYGGWILPPSHLDGAALLQIFSLAREIWRDEGILKLDYKEIPFIYSSQPSDEDQYALFRLGARVSEVNLSSAINLNIPLRYNKLRRRALKSTASLAFVVEKTCNCKEFMDLVATCLKERHDTSPVHSTAEMELLWSRFPDNIAMYVVRYKGEVHAGVMIYDSGRVAHAQYIASTSLGRELNLLTPLFNYLITDCYAGRAYFDFGISNENHGLFLNEGLLRQKFSYGATGVACRRWELNLKD